eukprot:jgi/Mesvir1/4995/Mv18037-RA.1
MRKRRFFGSSGHPAPRKGGVSRAKALLLAVLVCVFIVLGVTYMNHVHRASSHSGSRRDAQSEPRPGIYSRGNYSRFSGAAASADALSPQSSSRRPDQQHPVSSASVPASTGSGGTSLKTGADASSGNGHKFIHSGLADGGLTDGSSDRGPRSLGGSGVTAASGNGGAAGISSSVDDSESAIDTLPWSGQGQGGAGASRSETDDLGASQGLSGEDTGHAFFASMEAGGADGGRGAGEGGVEAGGVGSAEQGGEGIGVGVAGDDEKPAMISEEEAGSSVDSDQGGTDSDQGGDTPLEVDEKPAMISVEEDSNDGDQGGGDSDDGGKPDGDSSDDGGQGVGGLDDGDVDDKPSMVAEEENSSAGSEDGDGDDRVAMEGAAGAAAITEGGDVIAEGLSEVVAQGEDGPVENAMGDAGMEDKPAMEADEEEGLGSQALSLEAGGAIDDISDGGAGIDVSMDDVGGDEQGAGEAPGEDDDVAEAAVTNFGADLAQTSTLAADTGSEGEAGVDAAQGEGVVADDDAGADAVTSDGGGEDAGAEGGAGEGGAYDGQGSAGVVTEGGQEGGSEGGGQQEGVVEGGGKPEEGPEGGRYPEGEGGSPTGEGEGEGSAVTGEGEGTGEEQLSDALGDEVADMLEEAEDVDQPEMTAEEVDMVGQLLARLTAAGFGRKGHGGGIAAESDGEDAEEVAKEEVWMSEQVEDGHLLGSAEEAAALDEVEEEEMPNEDGNDQFGEGGKAAALGGQEEEEERQWQQWQQQQQQEHQQEWQQQGQAAGGKDAGAPGEPKTLSEAMDHLGRQHEAARASEERRTSMERDSVIGNRLPIDEDADESDTAVVGGPASKSRQTVGRAVPCLSKMCAAREAVLNVYRQESGMRMLHVGAGSCGFVWDVDAGGMDMRGLEPFPFENNMEKRQVLTRQSFDGTLRQSFDRTVMTIRVIISCVELANRHKLTHTPFGQIHYPPGFFALIVVSDMLELLPSGRLHATLYELARATRGPIVVFIQDVMHHTLAAFRKRKAHAAAVAKERQEAALASALEKQRAAALAAEALLQKATELINRVGAKSAAAGTGNGTGVAAAASADKAVADSGPSSLGEGRASGEVMVQGERQAEPKLGQGEGQSLGDMVADGSIGQGGSVVSNDGSGVSSAGGAVTFDGADVGAKLAALAAIYNEANTSAAEKVAKVAALLGPHSDQGPHSDHSQRGEDELHSDQGQTDSDLGQPDSDQGGIESDPSDGDDVTDFSPDGEGAEGNNRRLLQKGKVMARKGAGSKGAGKKAAIVGVDGDIALANAALGDAAPGVTTADVEHANLMQAISEWERSLKPKKGALASAPLIDTVEEKPAGWVGSDTPPVPVLSAEERWAAEGKWIRFMGSAEAWDGAIRRLTVIEKRPREWWSKQFRHVGLLEEPASKLRAIVKDEGCTSLDCKEAVYGMFLLRKAPDWRAREAAFKADRAEESAPAPKPLVNLPTSLRRPRGSEKVKGDHYAAQLAAGKHGRRAVPTHEELAAELQRVNAERFRRGLRPLGYSAADWQRHVQEMQARDRAFEDRERHIDHMAEQLVGAHVREAALLKQDVGHRQRQFEEEVLAPAKEQEKGLKARLALRDEQLREKREAQEALYARAAKKKQPVSLEAVEALHEEMEAVTNEMADLLEKAERLRQQVAAAEREKDLMVEDMLARASEREAKAIPVLEKHAKVQKMIHKDRLAFLASTGLNERHLSHPGTKEVIKELGHFASAAVGRKKGAPAGPIQVQPAARGVLSPHKGGVRDVDGVVPSRASQARKPALVHTPSKIGARVVRGQAAALPGFTQQGGAMSGQVARGRPGGGKVFYKGGMPGGKIGMGAGAKRPGPKM